jgi:hypothetical protein
MSSDHKLDIEFLFEKLPFCITLGLLDNFDEL